MCRKLTENRIEKLEILHEDKQKAINIRKGYYIQKEYHNFFL